MVARGQTPTSGGMVRKRVEESCDQHRDSDVYVRRGVGDLGRIELISRREMCLESAVASRTGRRGKAARGVVCADRV